ncbi:hypothetical protein R3P38DRAFT_2822111 [Favolaschia claudopus]|uniref:F-box domain-containing protein n=1 Tax=Favolaschia claudopus TaxID=2862362 RepID=A0AAW0EI85_9AGAR
MRSQSTWMRIPPELVAEITRHNAHDTQSIRAMALVSKTMRSFAIEHLFSAIHFACTQDLTWWMNMVRRTPRLSLIVREVKFSDPHPDWIKRHRKAVRARRTLRGAPSPPKLSVMPNVRSVTWEREAYPLEITSVVIPYMALFPQVKELRLMNISFIGFDKLAALLSVCGTLRLLALSGIHVYAPESDDDLTSKAKAHAPPTFDLGSVETLQIASCGDFDPFDDSGLGQLDFVSQLIDESPPTKLKSLTLYDADDPDFAFFMPCSPVAMEKLLSLSASSLTELALMLDTLDDDEVVEIVNKLKLLPAFPSLETLSLSLNECVQQVLGSISAAPKLAILNLRIMLLDEYDDTYEFCEILEETFPWVGPGSTSGSMKNDIKLKFPAIRRICFQFCVLRSSPIHFRRGVRKGMERKLRERLLKTGADIGDYLEIEWLDERFNPAVYSRTSGKPPWMFGRAGKEPETEASDYEVDEFDEFGVSPESSVSDDF